MKTLRHIALLLFCIPLIGYGQQVSFSVSKQHILLGEPFTVSLRVFAPAGKPIQWFQIDSIPHFEILERSKVDSLREGNDFILQQTLTLTSWHSGSRVLPPFTLPESAQRTQPIPVEVAYTSPWDPNKDYNPIKDIVEVQKPERTTWYWYVIMAVLLLLIIYLIFPKEKKPKEKKKVVKNPYEQAMKELDALAKRQQSDTAKDWYTALINVFRNYLYHKRDFESHSKTSDELAVFLRQENLNKDFQSQLLQTLRMSDAVKFARYEPTALQKDESIQVIKKAIQTIEGKA